MLRLHVDIFLQAMPHTSFFASVGLYTSSLNFTNFQNSPTQKAVASLLWEIPRHQSNGEAFRRRRQRITGRGEGRRRKWPLNVITCKYSVELHEYPYVCWLIDWIASQTSRLWFVYCRNNIYTVPQKNCAKLFLSELRQIYTNFVNFWQKGGKEAKIVWGALIFHLT